MLFGAPARYISYSPQSLEKWDEAVAQADEEYRHKIHCMVCGSDCHSHTARALDLSNVSTPPALARAHALFYVRPQLMRPSLPGGRLRLPQQSGARRARLLLWATRWHGRLPQDVARLRAARWDLVPHPLVKTKKILFLDEAKMAARAALCFLVLYVCGADARGADASKPHPHQGILQKYERQPPKKYGISVDGIPVERLRSGKPVLKVLSLKSGFKRAVSIQDVPAPPDVVWGRIMDLDNYPKMVEGCTK